jgi:Ca-activated chloride channel family protein
MTVLFLALIGCNPDKNLPDVGPDGIDPHATKATPAGAGAPASGRMATAVTSAPPPRPDRVKAKPPGGELIVNDCYSRNRSPSSGGLGSRGTGAGGGGFGRALGGSVKGRGAARPMAPSMSASAPPPPPAAAAPMDGAGSGARPEPRRRPKPAPAPEPKRKAEAAAEIAAAPMADAEAPAREEVARRPAPSMDAADDAVSEWSRSYEPPMEKPTPGPVLDWGATVYLSNDDSMSLASAQRMLWAVDQNRSFRPSEVRPHELLNYFSFDTAPVAAGETFSVLAGAEREGDTLKLAMAVQGAMPARQPLDLTLVIDRSGSMNAEGRMEYVKKGLTRMTEELHDGDRVDLVLFDSSVCTPVQNYVVGRDDPSVLASAIAEMRPRGSTDLDGGLREGYRIQTSRDAADVHQRNRRVLLLTDAMLNSGNVNEALVSEIGKRFEEDGIRVTGVGVGRDFNDTMLDKITEKGKGAYVYLGSEAVVDRVFGASFDSLVQTIAHDVQFSIELPDSLAMEKFYGEESSTNAADVQPINYYAGTSQLFLQDLKMKSGARSDVITFRAKYRDARTGEPTESTFAATVDELLAGDTRNLKKAQALMAWTDLLTERAMGDRSCSGLGDYRRAASQVQGDAEIAYVSNLTGKLCGVDMSQTVAATGVQYKVKVDADLPIPEVKLACNGTTLSERLSGSDTVARFEDVTPGTCRLTLAGNVPMVASVDVPTTGGDVRCLVRGGRVSCD